MKDGVLGFGFGGTLGLVFMSGLILCLREVVGMGLCFTGLKLGIVGEE